MSKRTMVAAMVVLAWVIATGCGGTACKVYGDPCYSTAECCGGSVIAPLVCGSTASNPDWTCNFGDATTCGNWMSCSKGSWKACSTTTSSYYESSDGTRFQCASRADCNDAINKIIAWCGDDGCGPSNCAGCCSGNVCLAGTFEIRCGKNGVACRDCSNSINRVCYDGICRACSVVTCDGCCGVATGACFPGTDDDLCGRGGEECVACGPSFCRVDRTCF